MQATTDHPTITWDDVERFGDSDGKPGVALSSVCRANEMHPDDDERFWAIRFIASNDCGGWGDLETPERVRMLLARLASLFDAAMSQKADSDGVMYRTMLDIEVAYRELGDAIEDSKALLA